MQRLHVERHARNIVVLALKMHGLATQRLHHDLQVFVEALALFLGRNAVALKLVAQIARAHAEREAAAREHVHHRVVFRNRQRVVDGDVGDSYAQADLARLARQRSQEHGRIGHRAAFMKMMLSNEKRIVAQ